MKRNNKIIILSKSIDGGTGTFIFDLLKVRKIFSPNKVDIRIIVLEKPSYRKPKEKSRIIYLRKKNFYPNKYFFSFRNIINFLMELHLLRKEFANFNADLILSIDVHCNLLSYLEKVLFFKNTKLIFTTHINLKETIDSKSDPLTNFILKRIVHYFYNRADALVCVSKSLADKMKKDFEIRKKIHTIYLGSAKSKNVSKNYNKKIIVSAGRLVQQKDFNTLIDSFAMLKKELPEYKLWIIGDGPLKKHLTDYVGSLNLSTDILFLGWKQNIAPYLKIASIFVLSSKREGFPYVLLEAMSAGLPVISTNTPYGPSEIIGNNQYGLLVPIGNKIELKNSMLRLLRNKEEHDYYSKKAIERSNFFSKEKVLLNYHKLINTLLS